MTNPSHYQRLENQWEKHSEELGKAMNRGDYIAAGNLSRKRKKVFNRQLRAIEDGEWFEPGDDGYEPEDED